jgi:hypothetical protein
MSLIASIQSTTGHGPAPPSREPAVRLDPDGNFVAVVQAHFIGDKRRFDLEIEKGDR